MFCDLVGSTGIAAQLDAEEWRDLALRTCGDAKAKRLEPPRPSDLSGPVSFTPQKDVTGEPA
jgi:hypothetical protein